MRRLSCVYFYIALYVFCCVTVAVRGSVSRPNFVFILADDLGYGEVGWTPFRSNHNISTPFIDKLAASGMRFPFAYAGSPVCAPSRCALMTGKHSGHGTIRGNKATAAGELPLSSKDKTFLSVLRDNKYHVSCVGKWGLGGMGTTGDPLQQGCSDYFGVLDQNNAHNMYPSDSSFLQRYPAQNGSDIWEPVSLEENKNADRTRCMMTNTTCIWSQNLFTNAAMAAIDAHNARVMKFGSEAPPLFLYLPFTTPHAGGWQDTLEQGNPVPSDGQFGSMSWPDVERDHASVITNYLDKDVGSVVDKLSSSGLRDNTVVLFASDNGASNEGGHDYNFFGGSGPLRGFKRCLTEGGIRTPLIFSFPGFIPPNVESNYTASFWDIGDTILDLALIDSSQWLSQDGLSFADVLLSKSVAVSNPSRSLYWEFCTSVHPPLESRKGTGWGYAVVNDTSNGTGTGPIWKILSFFEDQTERLYDIRTDWYETNDLSSRHPDVVETLKAWAKTQHEDSPDFPKENCFPS